MVISEYTGGGFGSKITSSISAAGVIADNTFAAPYNTRPIDFGIDLVAHSATKYLSGHDDAMLGVVVCKRADDLERVKTFRTLSGIVAGPDACFLLLRGLRTLERTARARTCLDTAASFSMPPSSAGDV